MSGFWWVKSDMLRCSGSTSIDLCVIGFKDGKVVVSAQVKVAHNLFSFKDFWIFACCIIKDLGLFLAEVINIVAAVVVGCPIVVGISSCGSSDGFTSMVLGFHVAAEGTTGSCKFFFKHSSTDIEVCRETEGFGGDGRNGNLGETQM